MNRQEIIRQIQEQSRFTYAQARKNAIHEAVLNNPLANAAAAGAASSGGGRPLGLSFVVNTAEYLDFYFEFVSTGEPIEFTIDWGDGNIHVDSGYGGFYSEEHTYAEVGEYTVKVTFDDPLKILELNFPGFSNDNYAGISSIIGLQTLSNLRDFRADYNYLESVNFSGLTNLTYVDISDCEFPNSSTHSLREVILTGCTALEQLRVDDSDFSAGIPDLTGLNSLRFIDFDDSGITGSVDISFLPALDDFDFSQNEGLTELIISSSQPLGFDSQYLNAFNCGLTQASVDAILVALSQNGISNAEIDLGGGFNAEPSATGLAAKSVLEGRGWNVNVNS